MNRCKEREEEKRSPSFLFSERPKSALTFEGHSNVKQDPSPSEDEISHTNKLVE